MNIGDGIVSLEFDRKDIAMNKLVVTTLESRYMLYDMRTQHTEKGFAGLTKGFSWRYWFCMALV